MKIEIRLRGLVIIILILSILSIIWIDFIPYKLEEWWFGSGDKFEKIIYSLSSSYVGSYIFYFLLVHLKEKNDKRRRFEEFETHLSLYISNYHKQLKEILSLKGDIITIAPEKPYKLQLENLIHIFEPAKSFSFILIIVTIKQKRSFTIGLNGTKTISLH